MSKKYDEYLQTHKSNVAKGFYWMKENIPEIFNGDNELLSTVEYLCVKAHDASKTDSDEYDAYDEYFYGNRSYFVCEEFKVAWLNHIHKNPHHWQHWILINDDPKEGEILLPIPKQYIIEMICDWWSFSWNSGNLSEIFDWYDSKKDYMKINPESKTILEYILKKMRDTLINKNI